MNHQQPASYNTIQQYFHSHLRALCVAIGGLYQTPFISLITFFVIGIAITLPLCFFGVIKNIQTLSQQWNGRSPTISLYTAPNANASEITKLNERLHNNPDIRRIRYISPEAGLKNFESKTGLSNTVKLFDKNPLPGVFIITPTLAYQQPLMIKQLYFQLKNEKIIDHVQLDMAWVKKVYYVVSIARDIAIGLACLFGLGVILVVGNTLRLALEKHSTEIQVLKLIGATQHFIRRPFLYRGFLLGFCGGLVACLLTALFFGLLGNSVSTLAMTYHSTFHLTNLSFHYFLLVTLGVGVLGLVGAWMMVTPQINQQAI